MLFHLLHSDGLLHLQMRLSLVLCFIHHREGELRERIVEISINLAYVIYSNVDRCIKVPTGY